MPKLFLSLFLILTSSPLLGAPPSPIPSPTREIQIGVGLETPVDDQTKLPFTPSMKTAALTWRVWDLSKKRTIKTLVGAQLDFGEGHDQKSEQQNLKTGYSLYSVENGVPHSLGTPQGYSLETLEKKVMRVGLSTPVSLALRKYDFVRIGVAPGINAVYFKNSIEQESHVTFVDQTGHSIAGPEEASAQRNEGHAIYFTTDFSVGLNLTSTIEHFVGGKLPGWCPGVEVSTNVTAWKEISRDDEKAASPTQNPSASGGNGSTGGISVHRTGNPNDIKSPVDPDPDLSDETTLQPNLPIGTISIDDTQTSPTGPPATRSKSSSLNLPYVTQGAQIHLIWKIPSRLPKRPPVGE